MTAVDERLLKSLRALGGKATVGDLAQHAGLASHEVEAAILGALSHVGGHVAVDERGNLLYSIERSRPLPSFAPPLITRIALFAYGVFRTVFFAALSLALVMYFTVYVVIIVAVLVAVIAAAAKGGDCDCDCDCKPDGCGKCAGDDCNVCVVCCDGNVCHGFNRAGDAVYGKVVGKRHPERVDARAALRRRQDERREERQRLKRERARRRATRLHNAMASLWERHGRLIDVPLEVEVIEENPPFFRAVRDFVFGPVRPAPSAGREYQNLLGFIRDHDGRITAMDAVLVTGLPLDAADRMLLELAVQHHGDVEASEDGVIVYRFDRFMVSAGADLSARSWLEERGGIPFSVEDFAAAMGVSASEALSRLEVLSSLADATIERGSTTRFIFDARARARLDETGKEHAELRNFHYCWERLEKAPAIIGVPADKRGWIYGFNTLNLIMSLVLIGFYSTGDRLVGPAIGVMSPELELWALGILPAIMSVGVFVIPLIRGLVEGLRDGGRKARNARRVMLLGLAHCLTQKATVTGEELRQVLQVYESEAADLERMLTKLGAELEATLTPQGHLSFERAHRELLAVSIADELDPSAFAVKAIVYDTAEPM